MPNARISTMGFTLAELLIALAILGVIATFTIPKILVSQQNGKYNAAAKEAVGMIAGAYQQAQLSGTISATTKGVDLTPYMNFVKYDTSGTLVDDNPPNTSWDCSSISPCLFLHNGGTLHFEPNTFGGTSSTNFFKIEFDPDGKVTDATTNGPGKAVEFRLYYNGRISSSGGSDDPSWFSWQ